MTNFNDLLVSNKRDDDYVNATALCKSFGKSITQYHRTSEARTYKKALSKTLKNEGSALSPYIKEGNSTYFHPLAALRLAQWLSPDFSLVVNQTFRRYLEADTTLATEIIGRSTDKAAVDRHIDEAKVHSQYLDTYHGLHGEMKEHGCHGVHHGTVNGFINRVVGIENGSRTKMTRVQKLNMMAAQAKGEVALIENEDVRGWNAVAEVKRAAVHSMYDSQKRKELR